MPRGGVFPRPVLRFRRGTAVSPREGLVLFGPLKGPGRIRVALAGEAGLLPRVERLWRNLVEGAKGYPPMVRLLGVEAEAYSIRGEELEKALRDAASTGPDVVVVGIREDVPEDMDMYVRAKQVLAELGVPSQMVVRSTLERLYGNRYVLFNLAVNIYAKAGGIAWGLADPMGWDAYLGLDVGGGVLSATLLVNPASPSIYWSTFPVLDVEYTGSVGDAVRWGLRAAGEALGRRVRSIMVLRDGRAHWGEVEALRDSLAEAAAEGDLEEGYSYCMVEVRKRVIPVLVRRMGGYVTNPEKGAYLEMGADEYVVATTGWPERRAAYGTVRPIVVARVDTDNWERRFAEAAREVYWLSSLHWGSMFTSPRTPIVTLYSHRISSFFRLGVYPDPERMGGLWFL